MIVTGGGSEVKMIGCKFSNLLGLSTSALLQCKENIKSEISIIDTTISDTLS